MNGTEEEFVPEEEAEEGPQLIKNLREKLKKALAEKQEYLEGWQRSRADFVNYKREESALHTEKEERIKSELIEALIPTLDALELARKHQDSQALQMLEKQFLDSLRKIGVERFGEVGEEFDPKFHEALAEKGTEHRVESVERSGYKTGERIIRPAQVII